MDFLDSLIARNVAAAGTQEAAPIQPRVASMFEPVSLESIATFEEPARPSDATRAETVAAPLEIHRPEPIAIAEAVAAPKKPAAPPPAARARPLRAQNTPVPPVVHPEVHKVAPVAESPVMARIPAEVARPDPVSTPEIQREAEIFVRQTARTHTLLVERPLAARAGGSQAPAPILDPLNPRALPSAVTTRRAPKRIANVGEPQRTPDVPEIHVTIGRVEVRAAAPAPGPARRSAPPGMTIEDYLRKRQGGGAQ